ncbi:permease [Hazenella sp. IB182353]|uniref:permease n=1 Tax=Polycladospora coralii TaxID=2771432 RepID=UPI00174757C2|nr:permease [Polycladospora coralii]MBS7531672.1 permease [Polycladospora coralii]
MIKIMKTYAIESISLVILIYLLVSLSIEYTFLDPILSWMINLNLGNLFSLGNLSTIFLSIFIEGLPFILLGVLISSFIQVYIKEETVWKWLPKNPFISIPLSTLLGLFLPICECGIVPVAKKLIQKGFPVYSAFTFLLAAPIINPVTIASTYIAFGESVEMVFLRSSIGAGIAMAMGIIFLWLYHDNKVLRVSKVIPQTDHCTEHQGNCSPPQSKGRLHHALEHSIFEMFNMGKYFVLGALIAATFQTYIGVSVIKQYAEYSGLAIIIMMGLAFGLSICSSADAFIAASFRSVLGTAPILAFLVYGPMMDMKNILMMFDSFKKSVVLTFFIGTTLLTALSIFILL